MIRRFSPSSYERAIMKAQRWTISGGRTNGNDSPPAVLYKYPDRSAKLVYEDGSHVRFSCLGCAVHSERLIIADGPRLVAVDN